MLIHATANGYDRWFNPDSITFAIKEGNADWRLGGDCTNLAIYTSDEPTFLESEYIEPADHISEQSTTYRFRWADVISVWHRDTGTTLLLKHDQMICARQRIEIPEELISAE